MQIRSTGLRDIQNRIILKEVLLCSINLVLFALLVEYPFPAKVAAFLPLTFCAIIIGSQINIDRTIIKSFWQNAFGLSHIVYCIIAVLAGIIGGLYYREDYHMPLIPSTITGFVFVAVPIAITEELIFRGFIQSRLSSINIIIAIIFAAFAHTCYKTALFLSPGAIQQINISSFFIWTFIASSVVSILKQTSKSVVPPIITHAVFDIIVYAEITHTPWWIW